MRPRSCTTLHLDLIKAIDESSRVAAVRSSAHNSDEPGEVGDQVEYFQNWVRPVAPLSPSCSRLLPAVPLYMTVDTVPTVYTTVAPTVHSIPIPVAVPAAPTVAVACTYCRKGGHQALQCRRRINDQNYMQVKPQPKRGRR